MRLKHMSPAMLALSLFAFAEMALAGPPVLPLNHSFGDGQDIREQVEMRMRSVQDPSSPDTFPKSTQEGAASPISVSDLLRYQRDTSLNHIVGTGYTEEQIEFLRKTDVLRTVRPFSGGVGWPDRVDWEGLVDRYNQKTSLTEGNASEFAHRRAELCDPLTGRTPLGDVL